MMQTVTMQSEKRKRREQRKGEEKGSPATQDVAQNARPVPKCQSPGVRKQPEGLFLEVRAAAGLLVAPLSQCL